MVLSVAPGFQLGDRVRILDGRSGTITAIRSNEDEGFWEYLLDPIFEFFPEFELELLAAAEEPPGRPPPDDDEPPDEPKTLPSGGITQEDLDNATQAIINAANLTAQANLQAHISQVQADKVDLDLFLEARFQELESTVTTTLSEIEKRGTDLEAAAEEFSGSGFLGFVSGLGGLVRNPVDWIMSRMGDHILSEVDDGLNR